MKKLSLNIDDLAVESFSTAESEGRRGTVRGYYTMAVDECQGTGECSQRTEVCGGECYPGSIGYSAGCATVADTCNVDVCPYGGGTKETCGNYPYTMDPVMAVCYSYAFQCPRTGQCYTGNC